MIRNPETHPNRSILSARAAACDSSRPALHFTLLVALSLLFGWLSAAALGARETPDLSGTWTMDKELSEDPRDKMSERRGGMRGGGRGGGMGGGRGGGMGGAMGGGRGGGKGGGSSQGSVPSREEMRQRMEAIRASLENLRIDQTDSSLRITYADSREQTLIPDDRKTAIDTPFGEGTIKAKWRDDGGLLVKTKIERRETTETYYVTGDGLMLTVLVEMKGEGPMGKISYKRIYRPTEAETETETGPETGAEPAATAVTG